jgi:hypothetical protein
VQKGPAQRSICSGQPTNSLDPLDRRTNQYIVLDDMELTMVHQESHGGRFTATLHDNQTDNLLLHDFMKILDPDVLLEMARCHAIS